ncbi:hypothetical protein [Geobacter sp.]|uniref:hypothetical protein n=1 Tax=Geobacter sp. TaxID=46610 RepID=UPI0027B9C5A4|nr:hypothetical protein [Geobacter sp.]
MGRFIIISALLLVALGGVSVSHAQTTGADRNELLGEIFKLQALKETIAGDIRKYDDELKKSAASISSSETILGLARQKGNAQAEAVARQALARARDAQAGSLKNKGNAELMMKRLERTLFLAKSGDKNIEAIREQVEFETQYAAWEKKQQQLIRDRLREPNKTAGSIQRALMANVPPLPGKTFSQLQSGDVLLIEPEDGRLKNLNPITLGDNAATSGGNKSFASHTVIYLKEVNGTKLFLDNQPGEGPRILTEKDFQNTYGQRGMDVATLGKLAEPLRPEEGEALYKAAMAMHKQNYQQASDSWWGDTNYGVVGKDEVVCSESNWALLRNAGKFLPKSFDRIKVENGIDFSPADFYNSPYFVVTPLAMPR